MYIYDICTPTSFWPDIFLADSPSSTWRKVNTLALAESHPTRRDEPAAHPLAVIGGTFSDGARGALHGKR